MRFKAEISNANALIRTLLLLLLHAITASIAAWLGLVTDCLS